MPTDRLQGHRPEAPDMSADSIAGRRFAQSWRGYDPDEVKHFLAQVAAQVRSLRERLEAESQARREAEQRALHPQMDEATLMAAVGEETAGILRTARSTAAEITAKAQANAESLVAEAEEKAAQLVADGEAALASKTAEAEQIAAQIQARAISEAEELKAQAQEQADELVREAEEKYQGTVEAAQGVREKILTDLARRRKLGSVQVEQLRAGRERLLDAYLMVRRTLDEVTDELHRADSEARAAADAVGHQGGEHGEDVAEFRPDEAWDALAVFSDPTPGADVAPSTRPPALAPPAEEPVPESPEGPAPAPAPVALVPAPPGTGKASGAAGEDRAITAAIVTGPDAIESVRIIPRESGPTGSDAKGNPELGSTADRATSAEPGPAGVANRDVDDLFARIRAGRAEATASARKALMDDSVEMGPEAEPPALTSPSNPLPGTGSPGAAPSDVEQGQETKAGQPPAPGPDSAAEGPEDQQLLRRRDDITAHLDSSLARKLKRALQDEQNSLLDRLRSLKVAPQPANVLPSAEEHPDRFVEAGRPLLEEAAKAGAKLANELVGKSTTQPVKPHAVEDLAEELGRSIAEPLRQRLELAFRAEDEEPSELADALGAAYREWKTQRIEAVARDQVTAAFSRGAYLALAQGTVLRWVVSETEGPCPDCEDNALAGDQTKGERWPTGQLYPPAHPGCRCALLPVQTVAVGTASG